MNTGAALYLAHIRTAEDARANGEEPPADTWGQVRLQTYTQCRMPHAHAQALMDSFHIGDSHPKPKHDPT